MRTTIITRTSQVIKPHVPLIRFRKGQQAPHGTQPAVSAGKTLKPHETSTYTIEDFQLPVRFKRIPLDDKEIIAINSGGAI